MAWQRQPFDPGADFVAIKPVKLGGREVRPGERIPEDAELSDRQLGILYDNFRVAMVPSIECDTKHRRRRRRNRGG